MDAEFAPRNWKKKMTDEDKLVDRLRNPGFYHVLDQLREIIQNSVDGGYTSEKELIALVNLYTRSVPSPFNTWYEIDTSQITWEKFVHECKSRASTRND
jgi:hypothetical protein